MYKSEVQKCAYYAQGRCKFGSNCRFSHEGFKQLYLMRHAESVFNEMCDIHQLDGFDSEIAKKNFQFNPSLIDCTLTKTGLQQIMKVEVPQDLIYTKKRKSAQSVVRTNHIDLIFVSPLNRALQTCQELIRTKKIKVKRVVVLPELTEVLSKICDFSEATQQKQKKFPDFDFRHLAHQEKKMNQINSEVSEKNKVFWQDKLTDEIYTKSIAHHCQSGDRYLEILYEIFPTPLEHSQKCFKRAMSALQKMEKIMTKYEASKTLVVSHNRVLKYIMGRFNGGRSQSFANCEIKKILL